MKRSICVWMGFAVLFVLTMFPPWLLINTLNGAVLTYRPPEVQHPWIGRLPMEVSSNHAAVVDYRKLLTEIALGESFVLALYLTWGTTLPRRRSSQRRETETKEQIQEEVAGLIAALRQNLRIKVGWDEAKIDRLIELERERLGNLPLQTLMGAAIEHWERDNR